jgi:hypothetical protein
MFDEILNFIKQEFSSVLSLVVGVIIGLIASPIIKTLFKAIKYLVALKDLGRLEKTYSSVLKYAKKNLKELGLILNKLPEEIVVETTYKDDVALFSRFRAFFKKNIVGKLRARARFKLALAHAYPQLPCCFRLISSPLRISPMLFLAFHSKLVPVAQFSQATCTSELNACRYRKELARAWVL